MTLPPNIPGESDPIDLRLLVAALIRFLYDIRDENTLDDDHHLRILALLAVLKRYREENDL